MPYRTKVSAVYLLGFFVDLINMFIANVAYPALAEDLQASVSELSWVSNGYILGLTLVIPLSAWLAQRIGERQVLLLSLGLFLLATLGAGSSQSVEQLISWRVVQGLGGGLLIPVGQTLAYQLYLPKERARLTAAIMVIGLLAPALSPVLGGIIVDHFSWRWVFWANLPLAILALALATVWLRKQPLTTSRTQLDVIGLFSGCGALFLILLGLTRLAMSSQWISGSLLFISGLLVFAGYVRHSLRHHQPLLNLRLAKAPLFHHAMIVYQCIPGIFIGVSLVAMLWLQNQLEMGAARVGSLMIPWSVASLLAIILTGKKFNHLGPRPLLIAGSLVQGLGIALLTQVNSAEQFSLLLAAFAMMGFGGSLCSSTAQNSAFLTVDNRLLAQASALWNINRQLSFCLGVAIMSLLLNQLLEIVPAASAYAGCFYLAAAITLIPAALSLRLNNRAIVRELNTQKESV